MSNLVSRKRVLWVRNGLNGPHARLHAAEAPRLVPVSNAQLDLPRVQSKKELNLAVQKRVPVGDPGPIGAPVRKHAVVGKEPGPELARLQTDALVKRRISILCHVMPKDAAQLRLGNRKELIRHVSCGVNFFYGMKWYLVQS